MLGEEMDGKGKSPLCPKGCKTKYAHAKHMRRLYIKTSGGFVGVAWMCPICKFIVEDSEIRVKKV